MLAELSGRSLTIGDFNNRHIAWGNKTNNTSGNNLFIIAENPELIFYTPEKPTRYSADGKTALTIDLVLSNNILVFNITNYQDLTSNHRPISFEIGTSYRTEIYGPNTRKNYKDVNWTLFKK